MTFRIRNAQTDALRRAQIARDLSHLLQQEGNRTYFDAATGVLQSADKAGRTSRYHLAESGLLEGFTTPLGRASRLRCDDQGRLTDLVEPSGRRTQLAYDQHGAPSLFARDGRELARFSWNTQRTETRAEFWDGSQASSSYSTLGKPLKLTNRLGQSELFSYDPLGKLVELVDARGQKTRFSYDELGRPNKTSHADGRVETAKHGPGRGATFFLNREQILERENDAHDRPLSVTYADGRTDTFSYDDQGRLVSATGPDGGSSFVYDGKGQLLSETNADHTFRFEYDQTGLLIGLEYPDGSRAGFAYDADKRLARSTWTGGVISFGYDAQDQRSWITAPNQLHTELLLDPSGKPTRVTVVDRTSRAIRFDTQYRYDEQSRLTGRADEHLGLQRYEYDPESQLLGVRRGDGQWRETFAYDQAGNRTQATGQSALLGAGNRLLAQGDWGFSYDDRGNLVRWSAGNASYRFEYNLKNQITEAHGPFGVLKFKYDALGRRIEKQSADRTIRFVWCGELLTREIITTPAGESVRDYLYRPGSYEPLALRIDGVCYYYHNDHQGTPQRLTDGAGNVVWAAEYSAFGHAQVEVGRIENPLRLAGQYADVETGLHYNRFRYYSPALGRYLSVDPVSLSGGHNLYQYVGNNPLNRIDPLGLWWKAVAAIAATVAAVVVLAPIAGALLIGAPLVVAAALTVAKIQGIDHFCAPCFWKGVEAAAPKAFLFGLGAGALIALAGPVGLIAAAGLGAYAAYAMLDEHFGWTSGKPYSQMTDAEKSESLGGLVGGTVAGAAGGMVGGLGGGYARGLVVEEAPLAGTESTGDESTGDESTGDESTGDESTGDESTGDESTGDESTGDESTGDDAPPAQETSKEDSDDGENSPERAPLAPEQAQKLGSDIVQDSDGSVRDALPKVNEQNLSQQEAVEALRGMYQSTGRNIAEVVPGQGGSLVVLSRNSGPAQPVNIIDPDGQISFGRGDIEPVDVPERVARAAAEPDPQKRIAILNQPRSVTNVTKDEQ